MNSLKLGDRLTHVIVGGECYALGGKGMCEIIVGQLPGPMGPDNDLPLTKGARNEPRTD